jgi:hypothetical protein
MKPNGQFDDYIANPKNNIIIASHTGSTDRIAARSAIRTGNGTSRRYESPPRRYKKRSAGRPRRQAHMIVTIENYEAETPNSERSGYVLLQFSFSHPRKLSLSEGSTPIDSLAIHTQIGTRCVGDGHNRIVPMSYS